MMNDKESRSLEMLHALADNELDAKDRERMLDELDRDPELTRELCDIRRVKDLLNYAYPLEEPAVAEEKSRGSHLARAAAVVVLVLAGFVGGWLLAPHDEASPDGFRLADAGHDPARVLLYIGDSDPAKFRVVLEKARSLLEDYKARGAEVYVVTSAGGVDLLRAATSPVAGEIKSLKNRYASLRFVACNNTLFNLKKKGKPVQLVDEAEVAPSAVSFVVDHLKQGWTYVAI